MRKGWLGVCWVRSRGMGYVWVGVCGLSEGKGWAGRLLSGWYFCVV